MHPSNMFIAGLKPKANQLVSANLFIYYVIFSTLLTIEASNVKDQLQDKQILLTRLRRQQPTGANQQENPTSNQQQQQGNNQQSQDGISNVQNQNQDEKSQDEAVSNLRCDFGSADAPDLCKFKILDSDNPLGKSLNSWTLGSGRLALYQGGPLIDASDRNDTLGGYIFYETSNPYLGNAPNQSSTAPLFDYQHKPHRPIDDQRSSQVSSGGHTNLGSDYTTITTSAFLKPARRGNQQNGANDNFHQVSSGSVSVSGNSLGPSFMTPNLTAPGPSGMCLSFQYSIKGLSAEELRIQVNDHKTERSRPIWSSSESVGLNWTKGEVLYSVTNMHSLTFSAASPSTVMKDIQQRKFRGYIALDEIEINRHDTTGGEGPCRGHCNFDGDLCGWTNAENGEEDDFDWTFGRGSDNLFTGPARDYISSSNNELTGSYLSLDSGYPRRPGDRAILLSPMFQPTAMNDAMCMRFAVHMFGSGIGSLTIKMRYADEQTAPTPVAGQATDPNQANSNGKSASFQPTTRSDGKAAETDVPIWEMSGDAGNSWHQAQTSVSSSKSPFQVVIEGMIGENHLGNIAVDEISFSPGPCPTSPPVASKNYGDCTFEQSMCYWRNPDADIHLDDLDWIRSADEQSIHGPNFDHTLKKRSGSYLKLENTIREPKSGTRAFLLSPIFQPKASGNVQCLSFYYYMFMKSISSSGPNLGTIRVYLASNNDLVPIWRLTNPISSPNWKHGRASLSTAMIDGQPTAPTKVFQIAFEGIWGDAPGGAIALDDITVFDGACDILPAEAKSVAGECTFDVDMCSWSNKTYDVMGLTDSTDSGKSPFIQSVNSVSGHISGRLSVNPSKTVGWQLATVDSRPVNLQDHTYKAPIGYAYVDVLDHESQKMSFPLQSAEVTVQAGQQVTQCLTFWFAVYGRQDTNRLGVYLTQASSPPLPPEEGQGQPMKINQPAAGSNNQPSTTGGLNQAGPQPATNSRGSTPLASPDSEVENPNAWKSIDGKLLWTMTLGNVTENNRRKWLYGQVTLKADSNHIVRFIAMSNDGGFAIDDISYFEGACETRPAQAKVQSEDDTPESNTASQVKPAVQT